MAERGEAPPPATDPKSERLVGTGERVATATSALIDARSKSEQHTVPLMGKKHEESVRKASAEYRTALVNVLEHDMDDMADAGESAETIAEHLAEEFYLEARGILSDQAEYTAEQTNIFLKARGKISSAFHKLTHNKKLRMGVSLGLGGLSLGVGIALGPGGALVGLSAARVAWRAATGYVTGEGIQELREGKKRKASLGEKYKDLDASSLTQEQRIQMAAELSAYKNTQHLENAGAQRDQILDASVDNLRTRLTEILSEAGVDSDKKLENAINLIHKELGEHLKAQNEQINNDKKANRSRRIAGLIGAAAFSSIGFGAHAIFGELSGHHGGGSGTSGGAESSTNGGAGGTGGVDGSGGGSGGGEGGIGPSETHNPIGYSNDPMSPEHYGDHGVAVSDIRAGEGPNDVAEHILSRFQDWDKFTPDAQHEKISHLATQLADQQRTGADHWRWTYEQAAGAYHFDPSEQIAGQGSAAAEQAANGATGGAAAEAASSVHSAGAEAAAAAADNSDTGGGAGAGVDAANAESGGGGGVEAASGAEIPTNLNEVDYSYNMNGFAEIPVPPNTTSDQLANHILGRFQEWGSFSGDDKATKVKHLANQLRAQGFHPGSKLRVAYDLARGSLNYER